MTTPLTREGATPSNDAAAVAPRTGRRLTKKGQLTRERIVAAAGQFAGNVDTDRLALALLGATQGGLLLSQIRRDTTPLATSLDVMIDHIGCHLTDSARVGIRRAHSASAS